MSYHRLCCIKLAGYLLAFNVCDLIVVREFALQLEKIETFKRPALTNYQETHQWY